MTQFSWVDTNGVTRLKGTLELDGPNGWQLVMDAGLGVSGYAVVFLGVLDTPDGSTCLYLIGSNGQEPAGTMKGVWQHDDQTDTWTRVATPTFDYNGLQNYGARSYNGALYTGDRRTGKLFRLTVNSDGSFNSFGQVATVGGEDVFPTVTVQGKLWLGTFGQTPSLNPGFYSYDGTTVTEVLETDLGPGGVITGIEFDGTMFYVAGMDVTETIRSIWTVTPAGTSTKVFTQTLGSPSEFRLFRWQGMIFCTDTSLYRLAPDYTLRTIFTPPAPGFAAAYGVGDTLYYLRNDNMYRYRLTGEVKLPYSASDTLAHSVVSFTVHSGYLWVTTNQPVRLYRRRIDDDAVTYTPNLAQA